VLLCSYAGGCAESILGVSEYGSQINLLVELSGYITGEKALSSCWNNDKDTTAANLDMGSCVRRCCKIRY
jgi:hypothetical protein